MRHWHDWALTLAYALLLALTLTGCTRVVVQNPPQAAPEPPAAVETDDDEKDDDDEKTEDVEVVP